MFGSAILDVAIGLILIYLLLSLFATAVREAVETVLKARAVHLERGIRELLDDARGDGLVRQFYEHPLINSLFHDPYEPKARRFRGRNLPTYIPARNFAVALLDLALRGPATVASAGSATDEPRGQQEHPKKKSAETRMVPWPYATQVTAPGLTEADLRAAVTRIPSPRVQRALLTAIDGARGDLARVHKNLEDWFDSAMDRVSGGYKRKTQYWLFGIGLAVTVALNINTIAVANHLARNTAAREALVRRAQAVSQDTAVRRAALDSAANARDLAQQLRDLEALDLPLGWSRATSWPAYDGRWWYLLGQPLGLLLTALAITLGAPFWFDALNKFMVLRSTVKPKEKSPEEASKDRQRKPSDDGAAAAGTASGAASGTTSQSDSAPPAGVPSGGGRPAPAVAAAPRTAVDVEDPDFTPHRWATGDGDEGAL
jgi:hypothetical protein